MIRYDYENEVTGEVFEVIQRFGEDPLTEIGGDPCHRIPCVGRGQVCIGELGEVETKFPQICNTQPATLKGCKTVRQNGRLKPIFMSAKDKREVMAKNDLVSNSAVYDT